MQAAVDTNVLVRLFVDDDPAQSELAAATLESAEVIAISLQAFCELAWVLGTRYQTARSDVALAIRQLLDTANVVTNRPAVAAGLAILEAGGDFADGVIAHEGNWLGGATFVTFDRKAAKLLADQGQSILLLDRAC